MRLKTKKRKEKKHQTPNLPASALLQLCNISIARPIPTLQALGNDIVVFPKQLWHLI